MKIKYLNRKIVIFLAFLTMTFILGSCSKENQEIDKPSQLKETPKKVSGTMEDANTTKKDDSLKLRNSADISTKQLEEILIHDFNSKNEGQTSVAYFEKFGQTNLDDEIHVFGYAQVKSYVKSKIENLDIYESLTGYGTITKIIFKKSANKEYQFESIQDFEMKNNEAYYKEYSNDDPKIYNKLKSELDINQLEVDTKLIDQLASELSKKKDIKKYTATDIKGDKGLVDLGYSKDYKGKKFKKIALREDYDIAIKENVSGEKSVYVDGFYFIEDQGIFIKDYAMYSIYADVN